MRESEGYLEEEYAYHVSSQEVTCMEGYTARFAGLRFNGHLQRKTHLT